MTLSHVTREEALEQLSRSGGSAPDTIEALCDLVRAEVHARKHAPRAATLSRIARLLAPAVSLEEERLKEACAAVVREGDVMLNPGGILYATPTRVVVVETGARIFSSVPTRALARSIGCNIVASGASRKLSSFEGLTEALDRANGVIVAPDEWAGLDRAPHADAAFLARLDQRLEWQALGAGSLEKDGALDWRAWEVSSEGARWRLRDEGRLWWARARFGGHHRAWTADASPAVSPFVALSPDDADRARFALSREVQAASALWVEHPENRVILELPDWLPRPEYRWLSLQATPVADSKGRRWEISTDGEARITTLLAERLGLTVANR